MGVKKCHLDGLDQSIFIKMHAINTSDPVITVFIGYGPSVVYSIPVVGLVATIHFIKGIIMADPFIHQTAAIALSSKRSDGGELLCHIQSINHSERFLA